MATINNVGINPIVTIIALSERIISNYFSEILAQLYNIFFSKAAANKIKKN